MRSLLSKYQPFRRLFLAALIGFLAALSVSELSLVETIACGIATFLLTYLVVPPK